jgi:hypothetical protein
MPNGAGNQASPIRILSDITVVLLERFYLGFAAFISFDAFGGCHGCGQGRNVGHFELDGGLADIGIVIFAQFSGGRIDDELDFFVFDSIGNIRPAFMLLEYGFGWNTSFGQVGMCSCR